jgi:hypothetical protein
MAGRAAEPPALQRAIFEGHQRLANRAGAAERWRAPLLAELRRGRVLWRPDGCQLAHARLWEHSYERLQLARLLGQLGVFLTCRSGSKHVSKRLKLAQRLGRHALTCVSWFRSSQYRASDSVTSPIVRCSEPRPPARAIPTPKECYPGPILQEVIPIGIYNSKYFLGPENSSRGQDREGGGSATAPAGGGLVRRAARDVEDVAGPEAVLHGRAEQRLGVDVKFMIAPPCIFSIDNHS